MSQKLTDVYLKFAVVVTVIIKQVSLIPVALNFTFSAGRLLGHAVTGKPHFWSDFDAKRRAHHDEMWCFWDNAVLGTLLVLADFCTAKACIWRETERGRERERGGGGGREIVCWLVA